MAFSSGSVSFRRFAVSGEQSSSIDQPLLDALDSHALEPGEKAVDEIEYGWCGGRHVLDQHFSFENNVFGDGLSFALRIDSNKIPAELKKAYRVMEEDAQAAGNPSGFISKKQKKQAGESARQRMDDELRSGKFRRSKMIPILWDLPGKTLYAAASGAACEYLMELFQRCFGLGLGPMSAGSIALNVLEERSKRREYEDLRPTRFVPGPQGESQYPEYPWTAKGAQPKDFLGNEFLLWLWHETERQEGTIKTAAGEVTVFFEKSLELDCAYGQSGRDGLRADGPAQTPEARDALRSGKVPRKAGLILESHRQQFSLSFNGETFAVGGAKLPDVEEADTARKLFEERIVLLRDLCQAIDGAFDTFLKVRCSSAWEGQVSSLRKWILAAPRAVAAVA